MDSIFSLAVHALVYLNHKDCTLSSEALAENICTNPARVRKVMAQLKKAGETQFAMLTEKLVHDSRSEELLKAVNDVEFREKLYQEYGMRQV